MPQPSNQLLLLSFFDTAVDPKIIDRISRLNEWHLEIIDALIVHRDKRGKILHHDLSGLRIKNTNEPGQIICTMVNSNPLIIHAITAIPRGGWTLFILFKHSWINTVVQSVGNLGAQVKFNGLIDVNDLQAQL